MEQTLNNVTTVLSCYKRPQYLLEQIDNIRNQTVKSDIWVDYTLVDGVHQVKLPNDIKVSYRNHNLYHIGRFFYALSVPTEYVFICDDDMMPGSNYLQHCIDLIEQEDCVVTGYGLVLDTSKPGYNPSQRLGWHSIPLNEPINVDMAGQSWFMKKSTLKYIAYEEPYSYLNGEDLHFSYMLKKYSNIPIKVASHKQNEPHNWSNDPKYGYRGRDEVATWLKPNHKPIRDKAVDYYEHNLI